MGSKDRAERFSQGPVLLARLYPVDYEGETLKDYRIGGRLWTVNWKALQNQDDILFSNERHDINEFIGYFKIFDVRSNIRAPH